MTLRTSPLFLTLFLTLIGCGDDDGGPADAALDAPRAMDASTMDVAAPRLDWSGTWSLEVDYTATCMFSSLGGPRTAPNDYTLNVVISGANDSLRAVVGGDDSFTMLGVGSERRLSLSGVFPGRDHNGDTGTIVRADNNVTLTFEDIVSNNEATGTIEGRYDTSGGIGCTIEAGGSVRLVR
ncbi:MAG: hypothetical protein AAF938_10330 [Myxococcota bacterium]